MAGLAFAGLIAVAGLVVQASQLYVVKLREQRTADLATLAAGNIASAISAGTPTPAAIATAQNIALINGFGSASVAVNAVNNGAQLQVLISKSQPTPFRMLFNSGTTTVASAAVGSPAESAGTCVLTLMGEIDILGGSRLTGTKCNIVSRTYVAVDKSTLNVKGVTVGISQREETPYLRGPVSVTPPLDKFVFSKTLPDPMANDPAVLAMDNKLNAMQRAWPYPTSSLVNVYKGATGGGVPLSLRHDSATVQASTALRSISVADATITFEGSGGPDPACQRPTTVMGVTVLSGAVTLRFKSGCYVFGDDVQLMDAGSLLTELVGGADVRLIFNGRIYNRANG